MFFNSLPGTSMYYVWCIRFSQRQSFIFHLRDFSLDAELGWEMTSNLQGLNTPQITGRSDTGGASTGDGYFSSSQYELPMDTGDKYFPRPPSSQNCFDEPSAQVTSASYSTFNNQLAEINCAGDNNKTANLSKILNNS